MPALTLYQGDNHQEYEEHPTEVARRALIAAADLEDGLLASHLRRFALTLPARLPIRSGEAR
jgi:hypothetical protein